MRPMFALVIAAALGACQPQAPDGSPAAPPADAPPPAATTAQPTPAPTALPTAFVGDIDARGTEPFWALTIRGDQLTLTRPDHPDLTAEAPGGGRMEGQAAVFGDGVLVARLTASQCSDGMSDLTYPLTAEVTVQDQTLKGCAAKTSEMPRGEG